MAKQPQTIKNDEPDSGAVTEEITYLPGQMDNPTVTWCGHTFRANVPKTITGHSDGTNAERLNFHLIESAKNNKHFAVGGKTKRRQASAEPTTAEEYRGYFIAWMNQSFDHADQMIERFARDRELQAACEVGSDDYSYLGTLFMPKLHDLARADELTEGQVAQLWINHGVNQMPW
jgi:hypothetical protein